MKAYWLYRLVFLGCIALSVGGVVFTLSSRQRGPALAGAPARSRPASITRPREAGGESPLFPTAEGSSVLTSRVRITTVVPYQREIQLYNFGDAAEDIGDWKLVSPRPAGDDRFIFPLGTVLLAGEALVVVVEEGVDSPAELHWRVAGDHRVLELTGDTVTLTDADGVEVSRFTYIRR